MANLTDAFARNNPIWNGRTFQEVIATVAAPGLAAAIKIKGVYVHISNQSGAEVEVLTTVEDQTARQPHVEHSGRRQRCYRFEGRRRRLRSDMV